MTTPDNPLTTSNLNIKELAIQLHGSAVETGPFDLSAALARLMADGLIAMGDNDQLVFTPKGQEYVPTLYFA